MKNKGYGELIYPSYFNGIAGSLHYLTFTRPNIHIGIIRRFMEKSYQSYLQAIKQNLRYMSSTYDHGIFYSYSSNSI